MHFKAKIQGNINNFAQDNCFRPFSEKGHLRMCSTKNAMETEFSRFRFAQNGWCCRRGLHLERLGIEASVLTETERKFLFAKKWSRIISKACSVFFVRFASQWNRTTLHSDAMKERVKFTLKCESVALYLSSRNHNLPVSSRLAFILISEKTLKLYKCHIQSFFWDKNHRVTPPPPVCQIFLCLFIQQVHLKNVLPFLSGVTMPAIFSERLYKDKRKRGQALTNKKVARRSLYV